MTSKEALYILEIFSYGYGYETASKENRVDPRFYNAKKNYPKARDQLENDLEVLHFLALMFDNNTLYRAMPYEKAKIISDYIDKQNKLHPEIRKTLNRISNEEWKNSK